LLEAKTSVYLKRIKGSLLKKEMPEEEMRKPLMFKEGTPGRRSAFP
jgi:hypothetical protein